MKKIFMEKMKIANDIARPLATKWPCYIETRVHLGLVMIKSHHGHLNVVMMYYHAIKTQCSI